MSTLRSCSINELRAFVRRCHRESASFNTKSTRRPVPELRQSLAESALAVRQPLIQNLRKRRIPANNNEHRRDIRSASAGLEFLLPLRGGLSALLREQHDGLSCVTDYIWR